MSSSQSRGGGERMIHQDYIARIRYSNALPPPPNPPKLLDIPNTGLASGQYTAPSFASRLAREQPLNIEADAELGMPLDLVGMPGPSKLPLKRRPLIPVTSPFFAASHSSESPRLATQPFPSSGAPKYISSVQAKPKGTDNVFLKASSGNAQKRPLKRKASPEPDKGTPAWIKRRVEKSFQVATANLAEQDAPFPDSGAYVTVKFSSNPVNSTDSYDTRLLSGIFKPIERTAAEEQIYENARAAWEADPTQPKPSQMMNYDLFLPADTLTGEHFRTKFDVDNPDRESRSLYTSSEAGGSFRFPRVRAYETAQEKEMDHDNKYDEERTTIRNQRTKNIARTIGITDEEETHLDELHVRIDEPGDDLKAELLRYKRQPVGDLPEEEEEEEDGDADEYAEREREDGRAREEASDRDSASPPAANGGRRQSDEEDAEGEEE
ncbi:hypothetical protein CHGG_05691 [Chaetomium globosum CBS 148.51]|uniref:Uncharacterized protein n=1 Tax=Chaetomium globosum (strain ATCC 6205 / CBS 148.51 / DSM 1962 / NBRC 6347 / NRRL 1970) TaxID=306901 RepID=Q2H6M4_CHAGB|nr:uncharacterized protein CHGG_05691 [Chaetomium globosum CBS 148.51]EAQ89072.1 hypothetical protein CHGG_05691 [Chaetomium globosum CBS 148.51]